MIIAHATLADGRENPAAAIDGATIDSNPFCSQIIILMCQSYLTSYFLLIFLGQDEITENIL